MLVVVNILVLSISILLPIFNGKLVDLLSIIDSSFDKAMNLIIMITALYLFLLYIKYITNVITIKLNTSAAYQIQTETIKRIIGTTRFDIGLVESGYSLQRINSDSNIVSSFIFNQILALFYSIIQLVIFIVLIYRYSILIGVLMMMCMPIYYGIYMFFKDKVLERNYAFKETQSKLFEILLQRLNQVKSIKTHEITDYNESEMNQSFSDLMLKAIDFVKINYTFSSVGDITSIIIRFVVMLIGIIKIYKAEMSIGDFTVILSFCFSAIENATSLIGFSSKYIDARTSVKRLSEYEDFPSEYVGYCIQDRINEINVENIKIEYGENKINFPNAKFKKGELSVISGRNGSGKSTFLDILLNLNLCLVHGKITINEYENGIINYPDFRKNKISVVEQVLDRDLILYKTRKFLKNSSNLDEVLINDFVGVDLWNKVIVEDAIVLSSGELQKLALLSVFSSNKEIIILDEPTSSLDNKATILSFQN